MFRYCAGLPAQYLVEGSYMVVEVATADEFTAHLEEAVRLRRSEDDTVLVYASEQMVDVPAGSLPVGEGDPLLERTYTLTYRDPLGGPGGDVTHVTYKEDLRATFDVRGASLTPSYYEVLLARGSTTGGGDPVRVRGELYRGHLGAVREIVRCFGPPPDEECAGLIRRISLGSCW